MNAGVANIPKPVERQPGAPGAWASWLLAGVVVAICLVSGEFILRYWFPLNGVLLQRDQRYLYSYSPGARSRTKHLQPAPYPPGETVRIAINREGRRGAPLSAPGSGPRVVVYGDSFIAAEYTPVEDTFVARLGAVLSSRLGRRVQVANAGVPGYGPDQESLVLEDRIDRDRPDLLIFALYSANDFGDLVRNKLFALDSGNALVRRSPPPVLDAGLNRYFQQAESLPRLQIVRRLQLLSSMVRSSDTVRRLKIFLHLRPAGTRAAVAAPAPPAPDATQRLRGWLTSRDQEYHSVVDGVDNQVHNLFSDTYDVDISLTPGVPSAEYKKVFMARIMERIHDIAARRSVPVVFLIIPAAIDSSDWDIAVDPATFPAYRRTTLTGALETMARDRGFLYLNLFEPFREHSRDNLYFHGGNDHWNTAGQRLAAGLMADYIGRNRLLAGTR